MSVAVDLDSPPVVRAAAVTGTAAVLVFALLPVLSGAIADAYLLDDLQTGLVASLYFSVYGLVALLAGASVRRFDWRLTARIGYAAMLAGLALCTAVPTFTATNFGLGIVAVGAGLLFPISLTLVSDMRRTDRAYAIKLAVEQLVPAALLFLLSSSLFAGFGLRTTLSALAFVVVICYLLSLGLPAAGESSGSDSGRNSSSIGLGLVALMALGLGFSGFAGLWAFLERIAVDIGLAPSFTTTWLAVGLITSGVGPLAAAWLQDRRGRVMPIAAGTAGALLTLVLLASAQGEVVYALVLTFLPLSYYFGLSYVFSVVADADGNGRIAGFMAFVLAIGAGSGPALFGYLRDTGAPVLPVMGALMVAGAVLSLCVQMRLASVKEEKPT